MKISERRIRDMVLGILLALVGYVLCACDGGSGGANVDGGQFDVKIDAIPAIDTAPTSNPCGSSSVVVALPSSTGESPEDQVRSFCVGKALEDSFSNHDECTSFWSPGGQDPIWTRAVADAECSHVMTTAECSDVDHDFVDGVGIKHAIVMGTRSNITGFGVLFDEASTNVVTQFACTAKGSAGTYLGKTQTLQ